MSTKVRRQSGEGASLGNSSSTNTCNNILQPKFYKIIVCQHECTRLRIPEDFASRYRNNMLNPVYLEVPTREVWEVEVEHSEGQIWLAKGWQDFCDYYSISCGNFLMFGYNARSHFNVTIFDLSAAEIEYPYSSSAHGIRTFHCHETHHAPKSDQSESNDSVDILEGIPRSHKSKEKIPDMVEHSVENLGHFSLGQSSQRKRHKGDAEDDVSVDMHIKRMEVEKLREDVASPSLTSVSQKSNKDWGMHKQQSKNVSYQNKTVMDKESAIAYQKAKAFKSKYPFIISFMQPSYVFTPFNLSISLKFARKYFLENDGNLVLRVPGSGSWSVKCTFGTGNAKVHSGWKAFVLENKLKVGDVCVFEVIKGTQLFVDVTIIRAAGNALMHNVVGEVPGGSDSKSKVTKTDNSVPCSQPKVVHTEKLKQHTGGSYGLSSRIKEEHVEGTEIKHSAEILGHYSSGQRSKRKRLEGDAEDDLSAAEIGYPYGSARGIRTFHCYGTHHAPIRNQSELDDSVEILEGIPRIQKLKERIPDMVEHSVENLGHVPLGQSSKRRRQEGHAEDDVSVDMHIKRMEVEKLREDLASPSLTSVGQKSNKDWGMHKQQSKNVSYQNKTVMDKERAIAYQKAKAFKSKNPFIISFMHPSYVFTPFNVSIPLKFARKYFLENDGNLVLRVPGSGSWSVKCTSRTGNAKVHSGWKAFVLENKLKVGDVCVFEVIRGPQLFVDVTIFRAAGSTVMHNVVGEIPGGFDSKSKVTKTGNSVPCYQPKVVHTKKIKQWTGGSYGFNSKIKGEHGEGTEIEHSAEILGHYSLGEGSKRKRPEGDVEDDVSIDIHTKRIKVEKSQQDAASPSCRRKNKKSGGSCRMHKQQPKIVYDNNKTVMDKERAISYQRAKAFKSRNPFVISFMQPSYIIIPYILNISSAFARKYLLKNGGDVVLRVPGRGSWSVRCTSGTTNVKIHSGWKAFALDNKLKFSDVCVFEVIEGTQLFIDVTIFRAGGSTPMHKIAGEKLGVSDGKNNITKTDNSLPYSQHKVVHTKKSKQLSGGSYSLSSKLKEEHGKGTEIEHSVEILSHCPLGHGSKRKRLEGEAEDDVSIDTRTKSIKVEKSQADVASPSFTRKTKKSGESCRMHKQQTEMVYAKNMTVLDKESTTAYQSAKAFTSKNPFVIYFMQPSYVSKPYNLRIYFLFAWKYFREKCGDLVLRVPGRGSWSVKYDLGISLASIRFTWKAFVLDNKLKIGDVCVFELIEATQPFLNVTIFHAAESKPMHKIDGVTDCKNKTIKTENSVPRSQPKIVHSRKLNLEKKQKGDSDGFITLKIKEELSKDTVKPVQQSKSSCMGRMVAKEMVMAYQKAKAFTSKNPFFISFMQPSYVSQVSGQLQLTITLSVARNFFRTRHSDVVLRVSSKREWTVKCTLGTLNAKFSAGWKDFVLDNNLKVGDVCVFEQASKSKLLFNVIIFSCAEGI